MRLRGRKHIMCLCKSEHVFVSILQTPHRIAFGPHHTPTAQTLRLNCCADVVNFDCAAACANPFPNIFSSTEGDRGGKKVGNENFQVLVHARMCIYAYVNLHICVVCIHLHIYRYMCIYLLVIVIVIIIIMPPPPFPPTPKMWGHVQTDSAKTPTIEKHITKH